MFGFKKKRQEEPVEFPYHYYRIVWTDTAVHNGVFDNYNKEIQIIKGGEIIESFPYTEEDLRAVEEVYKITGVDMTKRNAGDMRFEEMTALSGEFLEVR